LFFVLVCIAHRKEFYSIVDAVWALAFIPVAMVYAYPKLPTDPWVFRLSVIPVSVWALRLGGFLLKRLLSHYPVEDSRYRVLREEYTVRGSVFRGFFWFYQYQAWSVILLSLPIYSISQRSDGSLGVLDGVALGLFLVSLVGEAVADLQADRFKSNPHNRGKVCDVGLWKYSRHPNYFFEICVWVAIGLLACSGPFGIFGMSSAVLIAYLILKVTGIPMAEERAIASRGEAYREYQRKTSMLIPWFRGQG
jgi:steroid 5-alpha reductase family enzyme